MNSRVPTPRVGEEVEWNRHNAYFLALPLVQQAFQTISGVVSPKIIVDLGAGAGGFGIVAAQVWPHARRIAVEIRGSELRHLQRHYHEVIIGDVLSAEVRRRIRALHADLYLSNPPFDLVYEFQDLVFAADAADSLWFLRTTQNDALEGYDRLDHPPSLELQVGGRPHLRRAGSMSVRRRRQHGDNVGHRWDLYLRDAGSPSKVWTPPWWPRLPLPRVPGHLLRWTTRPGTEEEPPELLPDYLVERLPLRADVHPRLRGGR